MLSLPPLPRLNLDGRPFPINPALRRRIEALEVQQIGGCPGPASLAVADVRPDVLFAAQAWPHCDPSWDGSIFFTLTVEGGLHHFCTSSNPNGQLLSEGRVFLVDPMELHWLRPDPVVSTDWIGLQWVIDREHCEDFSTDLARAIEAWNAHSFCLPELGVDSENTAEMPAVF